ncbi:hypothetical protein K431DRAFT_284937 [Polychaeton citri CBS 116435]|uniref:Ras modification protein ERF4 n=1 Tax=Polychaeton citri CBS 116435 TaxID=1314669 RepID=A0A9P4Q840_9PEZI|nr:hypothetical protein K431DRAFT_284937 [Polychaeton citri CBS 116435]
METLHKIAGIEAGSDDRTAPAQPVPAPPPVPKDHEDEKRVSRASLPLSRKASRKSIRSNKSHRSHRSHRRAERDYNNEKDLPPTPSLPNGHATRPGDLEAGLSARGGEGRHTAGRRSDDSDRRSDMTGSGGESDDDFEWGPDHPCFPHPNSHVAPDSKAAKTTRVVRVRRDYMAAGDRYPQFANLYPEILDPLVSDSDFRLLITGINALCRESFDAFTWRAWVDGFLGAFTGWLWEDTGLTGAKRGGKKIERFVDNWNSGKRNEGKDVTLVQLRDVAFISLDFIIPDPGLDLQDDEE